MTVNISRKILGDMIYESAMYRLHEIRNLEIVREIWDSIDISEPTEEIEKRSSISKPKPTKRFT